MCYRIYFRWKIPSAQRNCYNMRDTFEVISPEDLRLKRETSKGLLVILDYDFDLFMCVCVCVRGTVYYTCLYDLLCLVGFEC